MRNHPEMSAFGNLYLIPAVHEPPDPSLFRSAYERRLEEIKAVPKIELVTLNTNLRDVVVQVLGVLPNLAGLKGRIRELPGIDARLTDGLSDYAMATAEADSRHSIASRAPETNISELDERARALRETIRSDALALTHRGLIDPAHLSPFKGLTGYVNVGFELYGWALLMRLNWPLIAGKTPLSVEEINAASDLGERLISAASVRDRTPKALKEAALVRRQAYTLLARSYDQVRRAVAFLRWNEGDANAIAPSVYAGRNAKTGRKRLAAEKERTTATPAPASAVAAPSSVEHDSARTSGR